MTQGHHHRGSLVWPVILIGAGIVLFLNNLGRLNWSVWETLFRLWPLVLVSIGLEIIIGRRSLWGSSIVALLLLGVLAIAVSGIVPPLGGSGVATTETITLPVGNARRAEVDIAFGAGSLNISALPESAGLIEGKLDLANNEKADWESRQGGDTIYFKLRSRGHWNMWSGRIWSETKVWEIGLTRDLPLKLTFNAGVGRSTLDLSQLNISDLRLRGGVGQVALTLPRRGKLDARIDGGVSEVTVLAPAGMALRIRADGGIGGVTVDGHFDRSGDVYTSPGYATAENRVDLRIDGGIGRVHVRQAPAE